MMNHIRLLLIGLALCALIGFSFATNTPIKKPEFTQLTFIRDLPKGIDAKHEAFWNDFKIYGRFVRASEVATAFDLPADSIPIERDSVMLIGYYVLPKKSPFGYFEFSFNLVVEGVDFDLGDVSFAGMTFSPKRLPFCKLIRPASGFGLPVPLRKLEVLFDKTAKLKLTRLLTK
jgi:hypothetical protein